jgi:hypothetical protein
LEWIRDQHPDRRRLEDREQPPERPALRRRHKKTQREREERVEHPPKKRDVRMRMREIKHVHARYRPH